MEKFENFVDEWLEVAKEGIEVFYEGIKNFFWLIFGSVLIVLSFPFWLIGKRERHLTKRALDGAGLSPEWEELFKKVAALGEVLRNPPRK